MLKSQPEPEEVSPPRRKPVLAAYLPAATLLFEIVWVGMLVFTELYRTGTITTGQPKVRKWDVVAALPLLVGMGTGLYVLVKRRGLSRWEMVWAVLGTLACGVFMFPLVYDFFNPL